MTDYRGLSTGWKQLLVSLDIMEHLDSNHQATVKLPKPLISLILDFDLTVTTSDTTTLLFTNAINSPFTLGLPSSSHKDVVHSYMEEYNEHVNSYTPTQSKRKALTDEIAFQRSLQGVEERSFGRVSGKGFFRGMGEEFWREKGRRALVNGDVEVRKGWAELVGGVKRWGVVSVSFQRGWVRGVCEGALGQGAGREGNPGFPIVANGSGVDGIVKGPGTGEGDGDDNVGEGGLVVSSQGKLRAMNELLMRWGLDLDERNGNHNGDATTLFVYVGDSGTDLECLTRKGVLGIVMMEHGESPLMKTLSRLGVNVKHIGKYQVDRGESTASLYWAVDFYEIANVLL